MKNRLKFLFILIISGMLLIPTSVSAEIIGNDIVKFSKCVDGDTAKFLLDGKELNTRFLAVDTPETKHPQKGVEPFGPEASEYTCNKLKNAKTIKLEYDKAAGKTDKYGRYLAWVWVDGSLLNKELISKGLAKVAYLYGKYTYTAELQQAEQVAKYNNLNIWSLEVDNTTTSDSLNTTTKTSATGTTINQDKTKVFAEDKRPDNEVNKSIRKDKLILVGVLTLSFIIFIIFIRVQLESNLRKR
jgi:micrococcal nuclease